MKTTEIPFTKCQNLPFKVKLSDSNFIYNQSATIPPVGVSCGNIGIVGLNVGTSKVTLTYYNDGNPLEDSVTISTFKPLLLLHPKHSEIVLAVGSSAHLTFTGGPRPVVGRPSLHKRTVTSGNSSTVEVNDITDAASDHIKQDVIVMNVLCLKLGMSVVTLAVTNNPISSNCRNQESVATVTVICGKPRSVFLQPEIKVADIQSCPMDLSSDRVVVQSYKNTELDVAVTDEEGRRFLNVSSLKFEWTLSPRGIGELGTLDGVFIKNVTEGVVIHANRSYQIVKPKSQTGIIEVTVGVTGYKKDYLRKYGITSEWPEFLSEDEKGKELLPITTGIHLYLVDDTVVKPNVTSIYNHPGNQKRISVEQGSGYYEITLSDTSIAAVNYLEGNREIEIVPINDGELKISLIDLCLVSQPAVVIVHVVSVSIIRIEMADKVEIGRCIPCIVKLYDENDNILAVPDIGMIDLKSSIEQDIAKVVRVKEDPKKPWPLGEIHYVVTGKELGETKVSFSISETTSAPAELQVFPPLRVFPRNTTLLVGSTLQFSSTGGPQPDSNVEYSAVFKSIADVSLGGLAQGVILGHTKIHARATGINPTTGLRIVYAEDTTDLEVISITGIQISIPLSRFRVGATVPAWASPIPEKLSPMILGSVQPSVRFEWDVDDPDIISINGPFTQQGIDYTPEDDLSIHVTGLKAGKTTLHLNSVVSGSITNRPDRKHVVYSTSIDIEIFEGLMVTHPKVYGETILMAPLSTLQLETNVDGINKVYYSLSSSGDSTEGIKSIQKSLTTGTPNSIVTVSESGLVQAHNKYGRSMIFVYSTDDYGLRQTVSLIVEVKPIHYMVINVFTNWKVSEPSSLNVVPLGTEFELRATYHDNTGAKFTAGCSKLKLRSNRFDLIRFRPGIDNSSVLVSVKKPGFTLLKVWAEGYQKTVEYIKLRVNQTFSPVIDHLTTGDIICVSTPLVSSSTAQDEKWTSSERGLVAVDIKTGIGRVKSIRGGQVAISHTLHPSASLQLQVVPASHIIMLPITDKILTNNPDVDAYRVPLVLVSEKFKQKTRNLLTGRQCQEELKSAAIDHPFTCHIALTNNTADIDITKVFRVQPGFNIETGQYTCDLIAGIENNPNISTIHSNITVWAEIEGGGIEANPVVLHFIPCIYVERELILSEPFYSDSLHIHGLDYVLDQVAVKPIDKNLLYVNQPTRHEQNLIDFEVKLLDYHWKLDELGDPMSLKVRSKLTNQFLKVHVRTHSAGEFRGPQCPVTKHSPLVSFVYNHRQTLAIIISMLVIFGITFYAYSRYINPVISVNIHPERSLLRRDRSSPRSPLSQHQNIMCATLPYSPHRSPSTPVNRNTSFSREPVYGDPSNFYSTSAELRRNRRIM